MAAAVNSGYVRSLDYFQDILNMNYKHYKTTVEISHLILSKLRKSMDLNNL